MNTSLYVTLAILCAGMGLAQQKQPVNSLQEDCGVVFAFATASSGAQAAGTVTAGSTGTTAVIDNRQAGCLDWLVTYEPSSVVASLSLAFQTATNVAGVPTTWSNYPGTLTSGINPNTAITTGGAVTEATGTAYPFLRMNITVLTGGGTVRGKLYGWKRRPTSVTVVSGSTCPGATPCVVVGNKTNNAAVPGATNLGVLPAIANAAAPTYTEGFQVLSSVDLAGATRVVVPGGVVATGNKTNNAAAPGATNLGVLPAIANAAAPTWTEGFEVLESVDLAGRQRTLSTIAGNGTLFSGQQAVTGSAVALATNTTRQVCVKALTSNLINVFIGATGITTSTGFLMAPGEGACFAATNTNLIFVIASTTGASVSWVATF